MKKLTFLILILFVSISLVAQRKKKEDKPKSPAEQDTYKVNLKLTARCYGDSIVLRWGYKDNYAWRELNKSGFVIERLSLDADNNVIDDSFKKLTAQPIVPWTMQEFEQKADRNDDYVMLAAQTLYGKSFDVTDPQNEVAYIQNKSEEARNRFSFALFVADISPQAATGLGLRFVDKNIKEGEKYIYRLYSPVTETFFTCDTAMFIIAARDIYKPVRPQGLTAYEGEGLITLTWPRELEYTAFHIERSDDGGKTYKRLNDLPYVRLAKGEGERNYVYADSLGKNYVSHLYRISGITSFGDISPWSEPVKAMGRDRTPPSIPNILNAEIPSEGTVKITWELPYISEDLTGFYIGRSKNVGGPFKPLNKKILPRSAREYIDKEALEAGYNYYIVASVDTATNIAQSAPAYVFMTDSIPPEKPTGLLGEIDTSGIVRLKWTMAKEPDIKGYRVYYSNTPSSEDDYMVLTNDILQATEFTDTITLNTLNEKIYYKIVAVDHSLNNSKMSETLELKKPDMVVPVPPVIKKYNVSDTSVYISWATSSSKDLAKQILYKKTSEKDWQAYKEFDKNISEFTDTDVAEGKTYQYCLASVDDDGLQSKKSKPLAVKVYKTGLKSEITGFNVQLAADKKSVDLSWKYSKKDKCNFLIYRSYNGGGLQMYASSNGNSNTYIDKNLREKGTYSYAIKAVFGDGSKSLMTSPKQVEITE